MITSLLEPHQAVAAGAVLARAFHQQPLSIYLIPDAEERAQALRGVFTGWLRSGRFVVEVCAAEDAVRGVAVWSAPTPAPLATGADEPDTGVPLEVQSWPSPAQERFGAYFSYMGALHARVMATPHWHLALLGVDPVHQGHGYGSALLRSRLAQSRLAGVPCYLETGSTRNVTLYQRHGFEVIATGIVPRTGVRFWALRQG